MATVTLIHVQVKQADIEAIEKIKKAFDCSTSAAVRMALRVFSGESYAAYVKERAAKEKLELKSASGEKSESD